MSNQEYCTVCRKPLVPGRYWYCDREEGPFCDEHFTALGCEKKHGEGCATAVLDFPDDLAALDPGKGEA